MENTGKLEIYKLEKNLVILTIITGIAPMFGFLGTIAGSFGGFFGGPYFFTSDPTFLQNGQTQVNGEAFLSTSFTSEAVPEPATLLLGVPAVGLALRRRLRRR